ncbi:MAG: hypothetical protein ACRD2L_20390 [Terriglobia bacterium]
MNTRTSSNRLLEEETLLSNRVQGGEVLRGLTRNHCRVPPQDIVLVHVHARVIGQAGYFPLLQRHLIALGKYTDLALSQEKPLPEIGDAQRDPVADDRLALRLRKGGKCLFDVACSIAFIMEFLFGFVHQQEVDQMMLAKPV